MTKTKFLPQALILSFLISLCACAQESSSATETQVAGPDSEAVWPVGPTSLKKGLLAAVIKKGVPKIAATLAFNKFDTFAGRVANKDYITVIDFTRPSGKQRLWMINTKTAAVDALNVAHGLGSDPNNTGVPTKFGNVPDSKESSIGAYLISEKFQSTEHGTAMRLDGLEATNDMVRDRGIILHSASYVSNTRAIMGMSWGCPAISLEWIGKALTRLSGGSFMFAYGHASHTDPQMDDMQIQALMINPAYRWVNESEEAPSDGAL
jgi:hypothetical protein